MTKFLSNQKTGLFGALVAATGLILLAQVCAFVLHYKFTDIIDSMVNTSIGIDFLHGIVLAPIVLFIILQAIAYIFLITWCWFVAKSFGDYYQWSSRQIYWFGMTYWLSVCGLILLLNHYYFPTSFFATWVNQSFFFQAINYCMILFLLAVVGCPAIIAFIYSIYSGCHRRISLSLLSMLAVLGISSLYNAMLESPTKVIVQDKRPNIIVIGIDSLRPDFVGYFGHNNSRTPALNQFLETATTFTQAYTPLGRTFPAWVSILTGQHPKHNHVRNNLVDPKRVLTRDTLAKYLQREGYATFYATDEKRFSNITPAYGFDAVFGPRMGVNDFVLGGLSDFPLTNLLMKLPVSRYLFPYNYGNRAAAITYQPDDFLKLLQAGLHHRPNKPTFLAVHLCLPHWPFTWAESQDMQAKMPMLYKNSVETVDQQFSKLLTLLQDNGLLENSIVFLLSDHGTGLGMMGDSLLDKQHYQGDPSRLLTIPVTKLSSAPKSSIDFQKDYTISASYGQGTNVLSLKQYRVVLAVKQYGAHPLPARKLETVASLLDVTPTILDLLALSPMPEVDGTSLKPALMSASPSVSPRTIFTETGDRMTEIETDHIYVEKVLKKEIGIYRINPRNGLLVIDAQAENSILKNKQLAVISGDWLLARFPSSTKLKLVPEGKTNKMVYKKVISPAYFVLANIKTGAWTIGLDSPFAKRAPTNKLLQQLKDFYGHEV